MEEVRLSEVIEGLVGKFGESVEDASTPLGESAVLVPRERILEVLSYLRDGAEISFEFLMDVTAVDYLGRRPRFEVVYQLYSLAGKKRLRVKTAVDEEDPELESATPLFKSANWFEREVWDMFGIRFRGHPDLRRILMYEGFEGHPLRKDYEKEKRQPTVPSLDFPDPEKNVRRVIKASGQPEEGNKGDLTGPSGKKG